MRLLRLVLVVSLGAMLPAMARAGAWTQTEGAVEILAGVTYSRAAAGFDRDGRATLPIRYEKTLAQIHAEYGWRDWLTLILAPEYAHARLTRISRRSELADDTAIEGGLRLRLLKDVGIVSAQVTAKTAGAFDLSVSADGAPGRQLEIRFLYGTGFSLFGYPGFFDAELAQRWLSGPRADEVPIDLTLGVSVTPDTRLMLQSFNTLAQGNASPPYSYFRAHKLSLSVVRELRPGLCLESAGYLAVAGQNALAEQGITLRLWWQF